MQFLNNIFSVFYSSPSESLDTLLLKTKDFFDKREVDKKQVVDHLEKVYQTIKQNPLDFLAVQGLQELFYYQGRITYGGNMPLACRLFQVSLILQKKERFPPIPSLVKEVNFAEAIASLKPQHFQEIEIALNSKSVKDLTRLFKGDSEEATLFTGSTLRWLGQSFQNRVEFQHPSHLSLFESLFGTAKALLEVIRDPQLAVEANWELLELCYNADRFLFVMRGGDKNQAIHELLKISPYLKKEGNTFRAAAKRIQVKNTLSLDWDRRARAESNFETSCNYRKNSFEELDTAMKHIEVVRKIDYCLYGMLHHNYAMTCFHARHIEEIPEEKRTFEFMEKNMKVALNIGEELEFNHIYFPGFFANAAEIALAKGDKAQAEIYLKKGEEIAVKTEQLDDSQLIKRFETLREQLK